MDPEVESVTPVDPETVRVVFTAAMLGNPALVNPAKYAFGGGLTAVRVTRVDVKTVDVRVRPPMNQDALYTLTVGP